MGACASRFQVLKDGANPPTQQMVPPAGDDSSNRLSFDHLLEVKNEGDKVSSERESKASKLVKSQDQVEGNCQENGSPKSFQPVDDPMSKKEVGKTPITEGLMCKTSEEVKTDDARGDNQSEESKAVPINIEQKPVEITGKDLNPLKTENVSVQERI
ncbi:uncharacterized protein [Primulina eburnea]|uniref:uncharacterized protein n=1 Tax=Primulina eburnea TaxID=1245227 RepID=UPI003C6C0751